MMALDTFSLLVVLIFIRSFAEVGHSSASGEAIPHSTEIAALLALIVGFMTIMPMAGRLSPLATRAVSIGVLIVILWTGVSFQNFGFDFAYLKEASRILAAIAVFVLAYRLGVEHGLAKLPGALKVLVGVPALALIVGYLLGWHPMLNTTGRATGTFYHANAAGAYMAVGAVACLWAYQESRKKSALYVTIAAVVALLLTQSLSSTAGAVFGILVFLLLNSRISTGRRVGLGIAAATLGGLLFLYIGPSSRLGELSDAQYNDADIDNSVDWRFANWKALISIWRDTAFLDGKGWASTFSEIQPLGRSPHSAYIQVLVETGLVGASLGILLLAAVANAVRRRFAANPAVGVALSAILITILVTASSSNWLNYSAPQYLSLLGIGVLMGATSPLRESGTAFAAAPATSPQAKVQTAITTH
jgi:O-antigen ligase